MFILVRSRPTYFGRKASGDIGISSSVRQRDVEPMILRLALLDPSTMTRPVERLPNWDGCSAALDQADCRHRT
jgi:hypothetical protein